MLMAPNTIICSFMEQELTQVDIIDLRKEPSRYWQVIAIAKAQVAEGDFKLEPIIMSDLKFDIDTANLLRSLKLDEASDDAQTVLGLVEEALKVAKPKAMFKEAFIDETGHDYVVVDGIRFKSRVLRVNLGEVHRVFPYVVTAGRELDEWSSGVEGMLDKYWADQIKEAVLSAAYRDFTARLVAGHGLGTTASMNPGSLEDWPISEQRKLFDLVGDTMEGIGVELTDSYLMIPAKSVSGIRYATEVTYENCQLCSRENCPGRRAPYDPLLWEKRYK